MRYVKHFGVKVSLLRVGVTAGLIAVLTTGGVAGQKDKPTKQSVIRNLQPYLDATGFVVTYNANGNIDTSSEFFQSLGTNGRSCATCHVVGQAMSFSATSARQRFAETRGRDPLFAPVDGANCPTAKTGDALGHSMILGSGVIRVSIAAPTGSPEFAVQAAYDPYGCAIDTSTGQQMLSFYRRPLPSTNVRFLSAVMFDGRESVAFPLGTPATFANNLTAALTSQALDATRGHAQASVDPTPEQLASIVNFEMGLTTAQVYDFNAGMLQGNGVQGGPLSLIGQSYYPGINDSLTPPIFTPTIFTLYSNWTTQPGHSMMARAREQIAAGEQLFNSFPINITDVRGINDNAALGSPAVVTGTCGTCHDSPNVGDHSLPLPLDIGTGHSPKYETNAQIKAALAQLSLPKLPVYQVTGCTEPFTGETTIYTTDLGKGALTGKCADLNRIKGPILRGLAARAPYFHNGAAANLMELVNFYDQRFAMGLTKEQKADLVAFLNTL
ncbi:MAG TPA: hypothetical protein VGL89_07890 [Candidatus Koribacter sp.]|jgi:hypothetical protein